MPPAHVIRMGALLVTALACGTVRGAAAEGSAIQRPVVVELFTSQGCSSCPPADRILGELATRPNILPLALHVDYWDSIGWRDRFAIPEAVRRQDRYVKALRLPSAFTPEVVVDGRDSLVGSDREALLAAVERRTGGVALGLDVSAGEVTVRLPTAEGSGDCDINFVAYLSKASTAIARGENSGRTLQEYNVVRTFRQLGTWAGRSATLTIARSSLPSDADRAAVFIQLKNQGPILGAAAVILP